MPSRAMPSRAIPADEALSRALSKTLRHKAAAQGFKISTNGWVEVRELLNSDQYKRHGLTIDLLQQVVDTNEKKRFEFNQDLTAIRARQGHSVKVEVDSIEKLTLETLPDTVVHGTNEKAWNAIQKTGLSRMGRQHIHMASGLPGEVISGMRHSATVLIFVDAKNAMANGIEFFRSANGAILSPGKDGVIGVEYLRAESRSAKKEVAGH